MIQYSIEKKIGKLVLTLNGSMDQATAQKFFSEFTSATDSIDPSQYVLEILANDLNVATSDMQDSLKNALKLYQSLNFKSIVMKLGNNAVLNMQVNRIAREAGLTNFKIV